MERPALLQSVPLQPLAALQTLVENRTTVSLDTCELHVFETHQKAEKVRLEFPDLVLTSMLRGKKVMHLFQDPGFDYLPGESVLVPPHEAMLIDFPEAETNNPTQCIALAISREQVEKTVQLLNEHFPKVEEGALWQVDPQMFHLVQQPDLADSINRLLKISLTDTTREKGLLANLSLRELLIRLMQTQARQLFEKNYTTLASRHRFGFVIQYIKEHLHEKLDVRQLSEKACMSRANFFRKFKEEFGIAPADYVLKERLRLAKQYLRTTGHSVTQVCYLAGFQNLHYFIRAFKKEVGLTPRSYQLQYNS